MEATSLGDDARSGRGCVVMATAAPRSPSSGYWSTNDDDLSNDVISASLGFDPASVVGYGACCWLASPYRTLETTELEDEDDVEMGFRPDAPRAEVGFGPEVRYPPEPEMNLEPEMVVKAEAEIAAELSFHSEAGADFEIDPVTGSESRADSALDPEMSLASGSSLLADFLFCDWLHCSRSSDRMFDELISGDVFSDDVFDGAAAAELAFVDACDGYKDSPNGTRSPTELERRSMADDEEEERTCLEDDHRILSPDVLTFDHDPVHSFGTFAPDSGCPISPISPLDGSLSRFDSAATSEEADWYNNSSGRASGSATPGSGDFRSACPLDSAELFDVLLCEVLRHPPETDIGPEAAKPELVLVATPSATKRKLSDDEEDARSQRPTKTTKLSSMIREVSGIRKGSRRIELPVTLVTASSNPPPPPMQMTSSCDRPSGDGPTNIGNFPATGKTQDTNSRTSDDFPNAGLEFRARSGTPKCDNNQLRNNSGGACAKAEQTSDACAVGNDACAVGRAEVLAAMLQAEAVLREPNRGSDVIFAELKNRRAAMDSGSGSSASNSPSQARGASSLRSFLIRKQRDSSGKQNLLHRLLKGETSEAEVRREEAASKQQRAGQ